MHKKTLLSPDGTTRNETDYICISSNWQLSIQDVHVFRGANCGSDHSLLGGEVRIRPFIIIRSSSSACITIFFCKEYRISIDYLPLDNKKSKLTTF